MSLCPEPQVPTISFPPTKYTTNLISLAAEIFEPDMNPGRPDIHFGSDPNFLESAYAALDGTIESDMML